VSPSRTAARKASAEHGPPYGTASLKSCWTSTSQIDSRFEAANKPVKGLARGADDSRLPKISLLARKVLCLFILANSQLFPLRRVILFYTSAKQRRSNEALIQSPGRLSSLALRNILCGSRRFGARKFYRRFCGQVAMFQEKKGEGKWRNNICCRLDECC